MLGPTNLMKISQATRARSARLLPKSQENDYHAQGITIDVVAELLEVERYPLRIQRS